MSLHVLVRFQHYFFFNEIYGLLTKRANMSTHQALAIFRVTFHWMPITGTQYATREVWPRVQARISSCTLHCCRMNTLVIRSIHCRGRLNVTFSSQVFVIVDVRLESTQLWKKCFKNILYSDRRVSNLPPVLPGDSWVLKEYISSPCESDT